MFIKNNTSHSIVGGIRIFSGDNITFLNMEIENNRANKLAGGFLIEKSRNL